MTEETKRRLRLDLQTFADGKGTGDNPEGMEGKETDEVTTNTDGRGEETSTGGENNVNPEENPEGGEDKKFTQADVDRLIKERLERKDRKAEEERERIRKEAEKKSLEDNEEFKKLADSYKEELDAIKQTIVDTSKEKALIKAGYSEEQVERYLKFIDGNSDEEIAQSVETLIKDVPPTPKRTYADPSAGNSGKSTPKKTDGGEVGKTMYDRIKGKIRK